MADTSLRYRRYVTVLIVLLYVVNAIDRQIFAVLVEPIRAEFGLTDSQLGMLMGAAFGISYALFSLPMGFMVDRLNRRNLLSISLAIWSAATGLAGFALSYLHLMMVRVVVGATECAAAPASASLISDLYPPGGRTTVFGLIFLGASTGLAISAVVGGLVASAYGWRAACFFAAIPGLILALVIFSTTREPARMRAPDGVHAHPPSLGTALSVIARQPATLFLLTALPLSAAATSAMSAWTTAFYIRLHGLDLAGAGLTLGIVSGIGLGLGAALTGYLADRFDKRSLRPGLMLVAGCMLVATPIGWAAITVSQLMLSIVLLFCWNLLGGAYLAVGLGALAETVPPRMRGVVTSCRELIVNLIGFGFGPLAVGWLSTHIGGEESLRWALLALTTAVLPTSAAFFLLAARYMPDSAPLVPAQSVTA